MLDVAVVDDDLNYAQYIREKIEEQPYPYGGIQVSVYGDPGELLREVEGGRSFDICFSDVEMPGMDGISLAERVRALDRDVFWIFLSSYAQHAIRGYGVNAYRYLLKEELEDTWDGFWQKLIRKWESEGQTAILLEHDHCCEKVRRRDIQYIYKEGKNVVYVLKDRELSTRGSLQEVHEALGLDSEFIRVERGFLVNMDQIVSIGKRDVTVEKGDVIPLGSVNAQEAKLRLQRYWRNGKK